MQHWKRVRIARANDLKRQLRSFVSENRQNREQPLSEEAAIKMMEVAAIIGVYEKWWLYGKPLSDPERIDSQFPF